MAELATPKVVVNKIPATGPCATLLRSAPWRASTLGCQVVGSTSTKRGSETAPEHGKGTRSKCERGNQDDVAIRREENTHGEVEARGAAETTDAAVECPTHRARESANSNSAGPRLVKTPRFMMDA